MDFMHFAFSELGKNSGDRLTALDPIFFDPVIFAW